MWGPSAGSRSRCWWVVAPWARLPPLTLRSPSSRGRDGCTAITLLIGLAVLALAAALQRLFAPLVLPSLLTVTTVALLVAQVPVVARQRLDQELGMLLLLLASAIVAVQALGLWLLSRRRHIGLPKVLVASQAVIGGPATAASVAAALGRRELILPAMALGMLGYLIGSDLGLAVAKVVSLLS